MRPHGAVRVALALLIAPALAMAARAAMAQTASLSPGTMPRIGDVDERYQSYNVEMVEVTGGRFWKPYAAQDAAPSNGNAPAGLFQYRPPIDLTNVRLRKLAAALGPTYIRVSGTWANATYFADTDAAPADPPAGFNGVLSRAQWAGVIAFAKAAGGAIVTSFASSPGTRDASGAWTPQQARRLIDDTDALGGRIAAAEFMNEPNRAAMPGGLAGYSAADYGRDFKIFRAFASHAAPGMLVLGPGSVGETSAAGADTASPPLLKTRDLLAASQPAGLDAFSYHHYGTVSQRCAGGMRPEDALSERWLGRTDETLAYYRQLRDEFAPGKPIWLTETADAACGGNPWARTFLDTFRYLDQLGRLARQDVKVVMHNTLVASDYGLLDDRTLVPKPNYWGALLWRKFMGARVLDPGVPIQEGLHVYAHCLREKPGGVALLVINNSRGQSSSVDLPVAAERYTLAAEKLDAKTVRLNGADLKLGRDDTLPALAGLPTQAGRIAFAPATITFLSIADAANPSCR